MNFKAVSESRWFKPALGAVLTTLCGLLLWGTPLGDEWINASYDYLFRFVSRAVTNDVALVVMDQASYDQLGQSRDHHWDRRLHTQLLDRLTRDRARLVVFDVNFAEANASGTDTALAAAMQSNGRVVLMANLKGPDDEITGRLKLDKATTVPPDPMFATNAAGWGIGYTSASLGGTSREHWPSGLPWKDPNLARAAAISLGTSLPESHQDEWLRYYSEEGPWKLISYYAALTKDIPANYFRNKIVFIGNWPYNLDPGEKERDKFCAPYTRWNGKAIGGVAIMATTFLNLVQGDWLRRLPADIEVLLLIVTGIALGGTLINLRPGIALGLGLGIAFFSSLFLILLSHFTNYWFPWLTIAGGQVPCALVCMLLTRKPLPTSVTERYPGYTTCGDPFGEGAYGKVWLVRDQLGLLHALKEIERSRFQDDGPYDREFNGIRNYKPISNQHPGLLRVEFVYRNDSLGYFIYVMELGDPCDLDWEKKGVPYQTLDLDLKFKRSPDGRLPVRECLSIGVTLADALDFLHQQGLTHRDIKPANIVFVSGQPKLADIGLVSRIRSHDRENTLIGTEGYMPPNDPPGTPQADIYALGKVLYVISTGKSAKSFSTLPTALVALPEFMRLNEIICKACHPVRDQRYDSASELLADLRKARQAFDEQTTLII